MPVPSSNGDLSKRQASMKEVIRLSAPVILSMISMSLLGLVDTFFMRWVGPAAQAAIGLGAPTTFSISTLFLGTLSGLTTFTAQYYGAKRYHDCGKLLFHITLLAFVFGVITALAITPLAWKLLCVMNVNPEIIHQTFDYMQVRLWAAPIWMTSFALLSFLRGIGNMKIPAIVSLITVLSNVPLTYIFTFGFGPVPAYGVVGAAIGTILSQVIELIIFTAVIYGKTNHSAFHTRYLAKPSVALYQTFFKLALPIGGCWVIEHVGWCIFGLYIGSLEKEAAAAHAIVNVFMNFAFMPGLAISIAAATLVGMYMGAGNVKSAEKSVHYSIFLAIACLTTIGLCLFFMRYLIAGAFSDDQKVITICANLFCFGAVYQVIDAMGVTTSGALRGAGDTRFPLIIMIICMWFFLIPAVYLFGNYFDFGVYGAWTASSLTCIIMGLCYFARFKSGKWKQLKVVSDNHSGKMNQTSDIIN